MSCQIIYNNQKYSIESFKDFLDNNKSIFLQDFISQDIEGFKDYVGKSTALIDTIDPIQNIVNKINSNFTEEDLNNQLNNCKI